VCGGFGNCDQSCSSSVTHKRSYSSLYFACPIRWDICHSSFPWQLSLRWTALQSATHQTFNVPRPLLSPSASHHSAIRLSQTTSTLHQCREEKGGGGYSFIHFAFILYPFCPRQALPCLLLPSLHWRQSGWTCDMSRLFDCRHWQPNTKAFLHYLTINLGDLRLDINST